MLLLQIWVASVVFANIVDEVQHRRMRKTLGLTRAEFKRDVLEPTVEKAFPSMSMAGVHLLSVLIAPVEALLVVFSALFLRRTGVQRRAKLYVKYVPSQAIRDQLRLMLHGNTRVPVKQEESLSFNEAETETLKVNRIAAVAAYRKRTGANLQNALIALDESEEVFKIS